MLNFLRTGVNLKKDARGVGPSNETVVTCLWRWVVTQKFASRIASSASMSR